MTARIRSLPLLLLAALALLALPAGATAKKGGDRDHDRLPDKWEKKHRATSATADLDADGLTNLGEFRSTTKPRDADSDNDGTPDGDEDRDRDQVDNGNELRERTDPRKKDTDGDRKKDGAEDADRDGLDNATEDATGNDPIDSDSDDDGVKDGKETAGTVVSFDGTTLTLRLSGGRTVTGNVDDATEIECGSDKGWWTEDDDDLGDDEGDEDASDDKGDDDEDITEDVDDAEDVEAATADQDEPGDDEDEGDTEGDDCEIAPGAGVRDAALELVEGDIAFTYLELVR